MTEKQKHITYPLKVKEEDADMVVISGYASVFDKVDAHGDIILYGAFQNALAENVKLLWQHNAHQPIGVISELVEDNYGLFITAIINKNVAQGREAISLIAQGAIDGLSIGFNVLEYEPLAGGAKSIQEVDLREVSLVTFPANHDARLTQRLSKQSQGRLVRALDKALNLIQKSYLNGGINDNRPK